MRRPTLERCGCCDRSDTMAICEDCQEPTCGSHLTSRMVAGVRAYVCTLCALAAREATARETVAA